MSSKEVNRLQVVSLSLAGRCTVREAAEKLGLSQRQVKRLREQGPKGRALEQMGITLILAQIHGYSEKR